MTGINLDALLGETEDRPLTYKGQEFTIPFELPTECLAPFLDENLGLVEVLVEQYDKADDDADLLDLVAEVVKAHPRLLFKVGGAIKESFRILLGDEQADRFLALRPGLTTYVVLAREVAREYGVSLTDFFSSSESSETDGTNSKQTSPTTTGSTPEPSGDVQVAPESPATTTEPTAATPETPSSSE